MCRLGSGETLGLQLKEFGGLRVWEQAQRSICTSAPDRTDCVSHKSRTGSHSSFSLQHLAWCWARSRDSASDVSEEASADLGFWR